MYKENKTRFVVAALLDLGFQIRHIEATKALHKDGIAVLISDTSVAVYHEQADGTQKLRSRFTTMDQLSDIQGQALVAALVVAPLKERQKVPA